MKKILVILLLIGLSYIGFNLGGKLVGKENTTYNPAVKSISPVPTAQIRNDFGLPVKLKIDKINVDSNVESVGMDQEGRMDVPKDSDNVAWYKLGSKPGDKGSAVIAGHFDKVTGAPAVFWDLKNLEQGDKIEITDDKGKKLTYIVEKKEAFDSDNFPLQEVFANTSGKRLNLITCNGTWDANNKNYSKRLVVFSKMAE